MNVIVLYDSGKDALLSAASNSFDEFDTRLIAQPAGCQAASYNNSQKVKQTPTRCQRHEELSLSTYLNTVSYFY